MRSFCRTVSVGLITLLFSIGGLLSPALGVASASTSSMLRLQSQAQIADNVPPAPSSISGDSPSPGSISGD